MLTGGMIRLAACVKSDSGDSHRNIGVDDGV
jgi:hypothetical protein